MFELLRIFLAGVILGNGPCLFICIPLVLPYIAGLPQPGSDGPFWKAGLKLGIIFSSFRLLAYSILGFAFASFYKYVFGIIGSNGLYLGLILGILVTVTGLFYLVSINQRFTLSNPLCGFLRARITQRPKFNMALFGLLVGFSPCPPLLAILTYIAATSKEPFWGLLAGFSFGLGTLFTPLIPLGAVSGFIVDKIRKSRVFLLVIRALSGAILVYFGLRLILNFKYFIQGPYR